MWYQLTLQGPVEGLEEVRVLEWHKQAGDKVNVEELIVELETHKVVFEMVSAKDVYLRRIVAEEGGWAKLDTPLAVISDTPDEPIPDDATGGPVLETVVAQV